MTPPSLPPSVLVVLRWRDDVSLIRSPFPVYSVGLGLNPCCYSVCVSRSSGFPRNEYRLYLLESRMWREI